MLNNAGVRLLLEPLGDRVRRGFVGEQDFDRGEAGLRGRIEAIEQRPFLEQIVQVCAEAGHDVSSTVSSG
jgi:hypothetical protein